MKRLEKSREKMSGVDTSAAILARRRRPVASMILALDPLRQSMRLVMYQRTNRASKTADKYGTFSSFFLHATLLSVWGNTERTLARRWRLVASCEALNPLYQVISMVLCWRISSNVKTGRIGVHSFVVDESGINLKVAY
jgi:hypothetical protein